ncbi:MAG: hypothetical protein ACK5LK_12175, partial [Chthoniobacterales bacterium]
MKKESLPRDLIFYGAFFTGLLLLLGVAGVFWLQQPPSNQELLANYSRAWDFFKGLSETGHFPWWSP